MTEPLALIDWKSVPLVAGQRLRHRWGPLLVESLMGDGEISLGSALMDEEAFAALDSDAAKGWKRWALETGTDTLNFTPGVPNLPVVVEPADPFHVLPGAEVEAYLRLPVTVVVSVGEDAVRLGEFPTELLSQTWFGALDEGEVCFWLATGLCREPAVERTTCGLQAPVTIRNESSEVLQVTRLCLRVDQLSIYRDQSGLWTNETLVRYQGGNSPSKISILEGPPKMAPHAEKIGPPRVAGPMTKVGRTFRSLQRWTADFFDPN